MSDGRWDRRAEQGSVPRVTGLRKLEEPAGSREGRHGGLGCFSRWFGSGTFLRAKLRARGSVTAVAKAGPASGGRPAPLREATGCRAPHCGRAARQPDSQLARQMLCSGNVRFCTVQGSTTALAAHIHGGSGRGRAGVLGVLCRRGLACPPALSCWLLAAGRGHAVGRLGPGHDVRRRPLENVQWAPCRRWPPFCGLLAALLAAGLLPARPLASRHHKSPASACTLQGSVLPGAKRLPLFIALT